MGCREACSDAAAARGAVEAVALLGEHHWPGGAGRWFEGAGGPRELPHSTATLQGKAAGVVWRENECHALIFLHKMLFNAVIYV